MLESLDRLTKAAAKLMLRYIYSDELCLSSLVDNLFNMKRIQDGQLSVTKNEVVDEIIFASISNVKGHRLFLAKPLSTPSYLPRSK